MYVKVIVITDDPEDWAARVADVFSPSDLIAHRIGEHYQFRNGLFSVDVSREFDDNLRGRIFDVCVLDKDLDEFGEHYLRYSLNRVSGIVKTNRAHLRI